MRAVAAPTSKIFTAVLSCELECSGAKRPTAPSLSWPNLPRANTLGSLLTRFASPWLTFSSLCLALGSLCLALCLLCVFSFSLHLPLPLPPSPNPLSRCARRYGYCIVLRVTFSSSITFVLVVAVVAVCFLRLDAYVLNHITCTHTLPLALTLILTHTHTDTHLIREASPPPGCT